MPEPLASWEVNQKLRSAEDVAADQYVDGLRKVAKRVEIHIENDPAWEKEFGSVCWDVNGFLPSSKLFRYEDGVYTQLPNETVAEAASIGSSIDQRHDASDDRSAGSLNIDAERRPPFKQIIRRIVYAEFPR